MDIPARPISGTARFRNLVIVSTLLLLVFVAPARAALVTVETDYFGINNSTGRTAVSTATFDNSGVTGIGTEKIQLDSIEFIFSYLNFVQTPTITPQTPDASGNFLQGTFLAIYEDGEFQHLITEGGAGGFAQPPAAIEPTPGPFGMWILHGPEGLRLRVGQTSSGFADYRIDTQVASVDGIPAVPVPAAAWLFGTALLGLLGLRRKNRFLQAIPAAR